MQASLDSSNNPIGALTMDGKYGAETAAAVQNATGGQSLSPCASYSGSYGGGGGGGGGYSAAVKAAAAALDAQLTAQGCCGAGVAGSALSNATAAFKQAILVTPSAWGSSSSAATVTGSTINVSDPACQIAFGSELGGTLADLRAVLGSSMTYQGSYCSNSSCAVVDPGSNCGAPPPPPTACTGGKVQDTVTGQCVPACSGGTAPANGVCPPAPTPPSSGSSSSSGALIAGVIILALGGAATAYAVKKKKQHGGAHATYTW